MTPSETPIQPDYTPMSVTGDHGNLIILLHAVSSAMISTPEGYPALLENLAQWSAVIKQAIKDQQLESSLNSLPFPEK